MAEKYTADVRFSKNKYTMYVQKNSRRVTEDVVLVRRKS